MVRKRRMRKLGLLGGKPTPAEETAETKPAPVEKKEVAVPAPEPKKKTTKKKKSIFSRDNE